MTMMKMMYHVALVMLIVGAINMGLDGLVGMNVIEMLMGAGSMLTRAVTPVISVISSSLPLVYLVQVVFRSANAEPS